MQEPVPLAAPASPSFCLVLQSIWNEQSDDDGGGDGDGDRDDGDDGHVTVSFMFVLYKKKILQLTC